MINKLKLVSGLIYIQFFHALAENINYIFITLYLWRQFSITSVIQFRIYELILIPVMVLIVGYLLDRVSAKISFLIGLVTFFIQLILFIYLGENSVNYLVPLALLSGMSTSFRFLSLNIISQNAVEIKDQIKYFSQIDINSKLINIGFPVISGLLVYLFGYNFIFSLAILSILIIIKLVLLAPIKINQNSYSPYMVYKDWDKEKTILFVVNFFWGIEYALFATLIPIIVTIMLNGELGWGIFTSIISLIGVGYSYFFQKSELLNKSIASLVIFGFIITTASIMFVVNPGIIFFFIFMIFLQLWQSTQMIGLKPLMNKIIKNEPNSSILTTEFNVFMEIPFMIGRLLLLLILFVVGSDLENLRMVGFLFAILGFIPLYESKFVIRSKQAIQKAI